MEHDRQKVNKKDSYWSKCKEAKQMCYPFSFTVRTANSLIYIAANKPEFNPKLEESR
jgi:hypothetical protein